LVLLVTRSKKNLATLLSSLSPFDIVGGWWLLATSRRKENYALLVHGSNPNLVGGGSVL
jgi:hypothetical protein